MPPNFTAHNILLDDGTFTNPGMNYTIKQHPWFLSARRVLNLIFPGDKSGYRLADLGCLEGGYSVEFARMGFQVVGIEIRDNNIQACQYVKEHTNLPNLEFVQDDVWNMAKYGMFDAVFCCGLLYHLDRPKQFLKILSAATRKLLIVQTHFSTQINNSIHSLSPEIVENEGIFGRWYTEFPDEADFRKRDQEKYRWASWDNRRSFWIQREYLLESIWDAGFDVVMEQFDHFNPEIARALLAGSYLSESRGTFIGIKSGIESE